MDEVTKAVHNEPGVGPVSSTRLAGLCFLHYFTSLRKRKVPSLAEVRHFLCLPSKGARCLGRPETRWISDASGTRATKEAQQMAQRIVIDITLSRVSRAVRHPQKSLNSLQYVG
jgi:hypothetical protein